MTPGRKRQFKDALFGEFARIGKALSSGRRLEVLEVLAQGERTVEELGAETGQTVANTSQHLQVLRHAQMVEARRDGNHIRYRLSDERIARLWLTLREVGETRLAEVERLVSTYLTDRDSLQAIDSQELQRRLREGSVLVLDVRPAVEFEAGHISGARSIPVEELKQRLRELPKARTVVAYCRGPYCVYADEAVALLRSRGFKAFRLEQGFPEWKLQGLPVESAASF